MPSLRTRSAEHMALAEVEDALAVYAEMNAFGELLRGEPLNLEVPPRQSDAALWSGRRLVDRAVIRTFKPGGGDALPPTRTSSS